MVFSSLDFLFVFLPAVLLCYYLVPKRLRNAVLLAASLIFYFIGEQILTLIMIASALCDYLCSLGIEKWRGRRSLMRLCLAISLIFNLGLLGYFKYADLAIGSFNMLTGAGLPLLRIALPIGISFYTFQTMSYTIDVYRGDVKAERNFLNFAVYVTLFPQLVAGPIVRYETVAAELRCRKTTLEGFADGVMRFCIGLAKKVLIANTLAELSQLYDKAESHTVLLAWLCAAAVPLQIYFDFSGYSDMAIGLGSMFGFRFPENFNYPMVSKSASEFWRRWHMTLGGWFRDYVYIPLGGSRCTAGRNILNMLIVWLATGLWHGAEYNFLLWGLYYGILIVAERFIYGKFLEKSRVLSRIYFAAVTVIGFEIFSASSLPDIAFRLGELVGIGTTAAFNVESLYYLRSYAVILFAALLFSLPLSKLLKGRIGRLRGGINIAKCCEYVVCLLMLCVCTAYLVDGSYNPFLYFRF